MKSKTSKWWDDLVTAQAVKIVNNYMDSLDQHTLLPLSQEAIELLVVHVAHGICQSLGSVLEATDKGDDLSGIRKAFEKVEPVNK